MARLRTVKPEFFDDEKLSSVSRDARLTFIGILIQSDDYGVVKGHPVWMKNNIYPYDEIKVAEFQKWITELEVIKAIIPFTHNGEQFYFIRTFSVHQKVDNPSKWKNPEPPEDILEGSGEASLNTPRGLPEDSAQDKNRIEKNRIEKKRIEKKGKENTPACEKKLFLDDVRLSDKQHATLLQKFGEADTVKAIEYLNNYKQSNGKKYDSDYHTILNWVIERVRENGNGRTTGSTGKTPAKTGGAKSDEQPYPVDLEIG
jgi:hypothetical protein